MTDTLQLKGAIVASGKTREEICAHMGISHTSLHKKIYNITEFKASEISSLAEFLGIENRVPEIFLAHNVENNFTNSSRNYERRDA